MSDKDMLNDIQEWADSHGEPIISYAVKDVLEVLNNYTGLNIILHDVWGECELEDLLGAMASVIGKATGYID